MMLLWSAEMLPFAVTALLLIAAAGLLVFCAGKRRKAKNYGNCTVTLLPKRVSCCRGALTFSVPAEFRLEKQKDGNAVFVGGNGVRLTVMQLPVQDNIRIRTLTGSELQRYFSSAVPMRNTPAVTYSFHGHSPALTAWWSAEPVGTLACLHLIQVPEALFLMQFTGLDIEQQTTVEPILYSVTVQRQNIRTGS